MNPFFVTDFSISDSLKTVRKSVLIYETIIDGCVFCNSVDCCRNILGFLNRQSNDCR